MVAQPRGNACPLFFSQRVSSAFFYGSRRSVWLRGFFPFPFPHRAREVVTFRRVSCRLLNRPRVPFQPRRSALRFFFHASRRFITSPYGVDVRISFLFWAPRSLGFRSFCELRLRLVGAFFVGGVCLAFFAGELFPVQVEKYLDGEVV